MRAALLKGQEKFMDMSDSMKIEILLKELVFALSITCAVVIFNLYSFASISLKYRKVLQKSRTHGLHLEVLRFVLFIMLLVIAMFLSLLIWVAALVSFDFVTDWVTALLFTAGFFTTIGSNLLTLPVGWRFIPSIIAFSGLFSFAWASASSIGMFTHLTNHLDKHKQT
jgi:hypothetical protein